MGFVKKAAQTIHHVTGAWAGNAILGKKTAAQLDPLGQVVGEYDSIYKPKAVAPIPSAADNPQSTVDAADIARRLAKAAQGRDSTIRTSPAGALYTSNTPGKSLLGS